MQTVSPSGLNNDLTYNENNKIKSLANTSKKR